MYDFGEQFKLIAIIFALLFVFFGCLLGGLGTMLAQWVLAHVSIVAR